MAIAYVQKTAARGAGVSNISITLGSNATASNALFLLSSPWLGGLGGPTNATPSGGGTWSTTTASDMANYSKAFIDFCLSATGGATTVTKAVGSGNYYEAVLTEFSGVASSSALDAQTKNTATSTTPTSGTTATTAQADELVLAVVAVSVAQSDVSLDAPATTGYTNLTLQQNAYDYMGCSADYKIVSATGAQSAAWGTMNGAHPWAANIATFKASAGGGDETAALTGASSASSAGTLASVQSVAVAGSEAAAEAGTLTALIEQALAGSEATIGAGTVAPAQSVAVSGSEVSADAGSLAVADRSVAVIGEATIASAGSFGALSAFALAGSEVESTPGSVAIAAAFGLTGLEISVSGGTITPVTGTAPLLTLAGVQDITATSARPKVTLTF